MGDKTKLAASKELLLLLFKRTIFVPKKYITNGEFKKIDEIARNIFEVGGSLLVLS